MKSEKTADAISFDSAGRFSGIMKYPAALCGTLGIAAITAESICPGFPFITILLLALFWCTGFYLLLRPKKGTIAGIAIIAAGCILFTIVLRSSDLHQGALRYLASGAASVWNLFMETIDRLGYVTLPTVNGEEFVISEFAAMYFMTFAAAAVFCLSTRKKTRLFVSAVFTALVLTPVFIYNMPEGNTGISLLTAACAALAAMRISEKRTGNTKMSGYSGIAALTASAIILAVPAAAIKEPWKNEGGLADTIDYLREIVTRIAEGDTSFLDGEYPTDYLQNRSALPERHSYSGREIMTVFSETDSALYLRTWIGGNFNGTSWETSRNVTFEGYTAEELTKAFAANFDWYIRFTNLDLDDNVLSEGKKLSSIGMLRAEVSVVPRLRTKYIPVPSVTLRGPFDMGQDVFSREYTRVGDGILMTKKDLSSKTPFRADVLITAPRNSSERELFHRALEEYQYIGPDGFINEGGFREDGSQVAYTFGTVIRQQYSQNDIPQAIDTVLEDFLDTSETAKRYFELGPVPKVVEADISLQISSDRLVRWINGKAGSRPLRRISEDIDSVAADDIATAISAYLAENYSYNINPPAATVADPMEEFLLVSKEGYCVQFATAMTLMMRRLGFPARYAEGYIANEFTAANGNYSYSCTVTDKKAHAWTEVWLDGFGWMTYEATPGFSYRGQNIGNGEDTTDLPTDTTEPPDTTVPPDDTDLPDPVSGDQTKPPKPATSDNKITTPPATSENSGSSRPGKNIGGILAVILTLIAIAVITVLLAKRSADRTKKRKKLISDALDGKGDGKLLCDTLFRMLGVYKASPGRNELPSAFETRTAERFGDIAHPALEAAERQIYGTGMTEADKRAAGAFIAFLSDNSKEKLGFFRFVWYRHIVCAV